MLQLPLELLCRLFMVLHVALKFVSDFSSPFGKQNLLCSNGIITSVTSNLQSQMERLMEHMNEMTEDAKKQSEQIDGLHEFNKTLVYQNKALACGQVKAKISLKIFMQHMVQF
ncbi:hypothetical protein K439DRAFT_1611333 [Ramaria rubella]|nr:hypothetical protein K439DRAFT_1611333 [Ramaria rubella]